MGQARCGGCSGGPGAQYKGRGGRPYEGLFKCQGCGGLIGKCFLGQFKEIVNNAFWPAALGKEPPMEQATYYDLDVVAGAGIQRFHGWFHEPTGYILQTG